MCTDWHCMAASAHAYAYEVREVAAEVVGRGIVAAVM